LKKDIFNAMAKKPTETTMEFEDELPSLEFIPFSCFLDKECLLTKNGDLVLIFKISSILSNPAKDLFTIRETFRNTIKSIFTKENITLYFTTVRKKASIVPFRKHRNYLGDAIQDIWDKKNNWEDQYVNEIYISIVVSLTLNDKLTNPLYFIMSLTSTSLNSVYSKRINVARKFVKKLSRMLETNMKSYELKILTFKEKEDGVLYSEHLRFLSLFTNLEKIDFPVSYDEPSDTLRQKKIKYGTDMIQATDTKGNKKFASVFTLKVSQELLLSQVDSVLQIPVYLVITETETFVDSKYVLNQFEEQKKNIKVSEDTDFSYYSGLDRYMEADTGSENDFCIGQTTFMLINDTMDSLYKDIKLMYRVFDSVGLVAIKETVFLPTIFWSQIPGNMRYLKRLIMSPTKNIGNYVCLFNFPVGRLDYNHWGKAITVVQTAIKTFYFLNFHNGINGNTFILGGGQTGKTTKLNFLISQALRHNPKIFYLDTKRNSEVFINAIGGSYYKISPNVPEDEVFRINPFDLEDSLENRRFLVEFIIQLVDFQDDNMVIMGRTETRLKGQYKNIDNIIDSIMNDSDKTIKNCIGKFDTEETKYIYRFLSVWLNDPRYNFIFGDQTTKPENRIFGISLRTILPDMNIVLPVVMYFTHNIINYADEEGGPSLFVFEDSWHIINTPQIANRMRNILKNMPEYNMATLLTLNTLPEADESFIMNNFEEYFATEIFLMNPKATYFQRKIFNIQDDEGRILAIMKQGFHTALLKSQKDVLVIYLELKELKHYLKLLANDNISINAFKKAIQVAGTKEPSVWVPIFVKIVEEYEKALSLKKLQEAEERQIKWEKANSDVKLTSNNAK
jgi:type IV secretion system protein VirB4